MKAEINVEFNESSSRQEIQSGEEIKTLFGKIKKWLADLKPVAFSGSYNDLSDTPSSLPASGGEAERAVFDSTGADIAESFEKVKSDIAINRSTLGYQSKNLLKNTAISGISAGISYTVNSDGSITFGTGTATGICSVILCSYTFKAGVKYKLSGAPNDGSSETRISLISDEGGEPGQYRDTGNGVTFSFSQDTTYRIRVRVAGGGVAITDSVTFYPMLRDADIIDDTYAPYQASLKEELDSLIVDSVMSDTSVNPVQNKVIKAYIDQKIAEISG